MLCFIAMFPLTHILIVRTNNYLFLLYYFSFRFVYYTCLLFLVFSLDMWSVLESGEFR